MRAIQYLWIRRLYVANRSIITKLTYLMQFQLKFPRDLFVEIIKAILKCIGKCKASRKSKTFWERLRKRKIVGGVTLSNFKIYSLISVIKTMWYWFKDWQIESANRPTHTYKTNWFRRNIPR